MSSFIAIFILIIIMGIGLLIAEYLLGYKAEYLLGYKAEYLLGYK